MIKEIELVKEFHLKFGVPVLEKPSLIPSDRSDLRYNMMVQENDEYMEGVDKKDLPNILNELADKAFVLFGDVLEHGFQDVFVEAFIEVCKANMTRTRTEYKIKKGEGYIAPNIVRILTTCKACRMEILLDKSIDRSITTNEREYITLNMTSKHTCTLNV